jgi:hypothetical protein
MILIFTKTRNDTTKKSITRNDTTKKSITRNDTTKKINN